MKQYKTALLIILTVFVTSAYMQGAQQTRPCVLVSVSGGKVSLKNRKLGPGTLNLQLDQNDQIQAVNTLSKVVIMYKGQTVSRSLHQGKIIKVQDIIRSRFFMIDNEHGIKDIVVLLWDRFMKNDESPEQFSERYLKEYGGTKKGGSSDVLSDGDYETELSTEDQKELRSITFPEHLNQDGLDSARFYLKKAVFLESRNYLKMAAGFYRKSYDNRGKDKPTSKLITQIFQQFLFRMGQIQAGNKLADN